MVSVNEVRELMRAFKDIDPGFDVWGMAGVYQKTLEAYSAEEIKAAIQGVEEVMKPEEIRQAIDGKVYVGNEWEESVRKLTRKLYEEMNGHIPATIESVYQTLKTSFDDDPNVRLWAKQMIAEIEGWPTIPWKQQTDAQKRFVKGKLQQRNYEVRFLKFVGSDWAACARVRGSDYVV